MIQLEAKEKPKPNIKYNGKVHKASSFYTGIYCNHVELDEEELEHTSNEINCDRCIEMEEMFREAAEDMAQTIDEEIVENSKNIFNED